MCKVFRRQPFLSLNETIQCAKLYEECGECFPGYLFKSYKVYLHFSARTISISLYRYEAEILVSGQPDIYCNLRGSASPPIELSVTTGGPPVVLPDTSNYSSKTLIIVGTVGGILFIILLILFIFLLSKHSRVFKRRQLTDVSWFEINIITFSFLFQRNLDAVVATKSCDASSAIRW